MMRWNSTKTYTEDDMLRMQQEAVNRVQEFQSRAQQTLPYYDVPESAITPYSDPPPPTLYSISDLESETLVSEPNDQLVQTAPPPHSSDPISGLFEKFNLDGETLLILGLIYLLYNEKADNTLLMALGYLLL